ncbi:MAG: AI-2E family transporter [Acidobacteria bacterium]|nr:AI-2E family transporter [Acidobacteriota bacterium]
MRRSTNQFSVVIMWAGLALLAYLLFLIVQPFLVPLGWGCVIAVLIYPIQREFERRMSRGTAAGVSTLLAALILIGPSIALTNAFAREMVDLAQSLQASFSGGTPAVVQELRELLQNVPYASRVDLGSMSTDALQKTATFLMSQSGSILTNIAVFFVDLALALFATFFLLRDADDIMHAVRRLLPMSPTAREAFITRTADLIAAGVTSSVIVAALQGFLGGVAFAIVGLRAPIFWGVVMGFACLLPFGAAIVWLPAGIFLALSGSYTKALILIGLGAGVVSMVDNVVRPLLLSGRVQMNGLVIFVSLLGGLNVFGLLGIVLGPIVVVTAMALVSSYVETVPEEGAHSPITPP